MPRELLHIRHKLCLLSLRCSSTNAAPERDGLACYLAMERAEEELLRVRRVDEVEPAPVDAGRRAWQGVVRMPEKGGCVCKVAGNALVIHLRADINTLRRLLAVGRWLLKTDSRTRPIILSAFFRFNSIPSQRIARRSLTQFLCPSNNALACSNTCAYTSCFVKPSAKADASA